MTSGSNNINDFPDNQLTKFCVFTDWSQIFIPPKFIWSTALLPPPSRTNSNRENRRPTNLLSVKSQTGQPVDQSTVQNVCL